MSARNVKGVHGRGRKMSVHNGMRRDENDEMRARSVELIMMINEGLATTIMISNNLGAGQSTKVTKLISDRESFRKLNGRINFRNGRGEITVLRDKKTIGEFFMFATIKTFDFSKASPPGIKFVIGNGDDFKVRWNRQEDLVLSASISIVKFNAISTNFVSFGSSVRGRNFELSSSNITRRLSIKKRHRSKRFTFCTVQNTFAD